MTNKKSIQRKGRYSTTRDRESRRADMRTDAEESGYSRTIRNINLQATRLKNKAPEKSKEMRKDISALKRMEKTSKSAKSAKSKSAKSKSAKSK